MSQYSSESGKNTRRNTHKGLSDLLGLGRGLPEDKDTNYSSLCVIISIMYLQMRILNPDISFLPINSL